MCTSAPSKATIELSELDPRVQSLSGEFGGGFEGALAYMLYSRCVVDEGELQSLEQDYRCLLALACTSWVSQIPVGGETQLLHHPYIFRRLLGLKVLKWYIARTIICDIILVLYSKFPLFSVFYESQTAIPVFLLEGDLTIYKLSPYNMLRSQEHFNFKRNLQKQVM